MTVDALDGYAGRPLSASQSAFLTLLDAQGFDLVLTGTGKTIRIHHDGRNVGYVNSVVIQREALLGYRFLDNDNDACPFPDNLLEWACKQFSCSAADLDIYEGRGSNAGRTFLHIKSDSTARRALQIEAGMDPSHEKVFIPEGHVYVEGGEFDVVSRGRERDVAAKKACLAHYGYDCFVCGANLKRLYSDLPHELIHVHHEEPLAQASGEREFDPIATMKPLCPNCHCVAHARTPPYTVAELRKML